MSILSNKPTESLPDVGKVAAKLHDLWVKGQQAKGVFSSKVRPNDPTEEETMVPWDQLSEASKAVARLPAEQVYACIDAVAEEAAGSKSQKK